MRDAGNDRAQEAADREESDAHLLRLRSDRRFLTDLGMAAVIVFTLLATLVTGKMVGSYLAINRLTDLNQKQVEIWRGIGATVDYLLTRGDEAEDPNSGLIVERLQAHIAALLRQESDNERDFQTQLAKSWGGAFFSPIEPGDGADKLMQGISPEFHAKAAESSHAPRYVVESGFSHWDPLSSISFQSGQFLNPLLERQELLQRFEVQAIERFWRYLAICGAVLICVILIVWLFLFRPTLRLLYNTREEMRQLVDNVPAMVASYDREFRLRSVNRNYFRRIGRANVGSHIADVLGRTNWNRVRPVMEAAMEGESADFDLLIKLATEWRMFNIKYMPIRNERGVVSRVSVLATDIHERHEAERVTRENEENLQITLNSIGDAVISTDIEGNVQRINPSACKLTGWSQRDAVGAPAGEVFRKLVSPSGEPSPCLIGQVLATGRSQDAARDSILISRDGRKLNVSESAAPIKANDGSIIGAVLVFRDITEQTILDRKLAEGEKMRAIGQIAAGVAHDINNNLAVVQGSAQLALLDLNPDWDRKTVSRLNNIVESCKRAADLISKLNTFARQGADPTSLVDVGALLKSTVQLLENSIDKRVEIDFTARAGPATVIGNASQLQAAFMNVGFNAIQAMRNEGRLSIDLDIADAADLDRDDPAAAGLPEGGYIRIAFRDTGPGIPPEHLTRIFEPFFTTKAERSGGVGLGLATVYGTIAECGGAVTAANATGGGAVFTIFLPFATEAPVKGGGKIRIAAPRTPSALGLNVLLVDDEARLLEICKDFLDLLGCYAILAKDGEEALKLYREQGDRIDLVVLDLNMPRMSGEDTFAALKEIDPDVAVIVATGLLPAVNAPLREDPSIVDVLNKPFQFEDFSRLVTRFASRR